MFQHQGIWLPDGEKHFPAWMDANGEIVDGRGTYQIKKWRACLPYIKNWRRAIDVGSHVGFWTIQMVKSFGRVEAFEPMAPFRACFKRNLLTVNGGDNPNVILHRYPLGDGNRNVTMVYDPADSGGTHVGGEGDMKMMMLDSFVFSDVDFVKIDCEGYEHHVLKGARDTLIRCKPCVIVEQKEHKMKPNFGIDGTPACDYLRELGAYMRTAISGDYVFSWE